MSTLKELKAKHKEQSRELQNQHQQASEAFVMNLHHEKEMLKEEQETEIRTLLLKTLEAQKWGMSATILELGIVTQQFYTLLARTGLMDLYKKNNPGPGRRSSSPFISPTAKKRKQRKY